MIALTREPTIANILAALEDPRFMRCGLWMREVEKVVPLAKRDIHFAGDLTQEAVIKLVHLMRACEASLPDHMVGEEWLREAALFLRSNPSLEQDILQACHEAKSPFGPPEKEGAKTWYEGECVGKVILRWVRRFARNRWRTHAPTHLPSINEGVEPADPEGIESQIQSLNEQLSEKIVEYYVSYLHQKLCAATGEQDLKHMQDLRVSTRMFLRGHAPDPARSERQRAYLAALTAVFGRDGSSRTAYEAKHPAAAEAIEDMEDFPVLNTIELASILWLATSLALGVGQVEIEDYVREHIPAVPPQTTVRAWAPNLVAHATEFARSLVGTWMFHRVQNGPYQGAAGMLFHASPLSLNAVMLVDEWSHFRLFVRNTTRGI